MKKILLFVLLTEALVHAFTYQTHVLHNPTINQTIYIASDSHVDTNSAREERSWWLWFMRMLKNNEPNPQQGVYCIIEDMLTLNEEHPEVARYIDAVKRGLQNDLCKQTIIGLVKDCQKRKIPCCNIEFRQLESTSLSRYRVDATDIINRQYELIEKISAFDINPQYNHVFTQRLTQYQRTIFDPLKPYLEALRADDASIGKMIELSEYNTCIDQVLRAINIGPAPKDKQERKFFLFHYFNVTLLELLALYEIGTHQHVRNIVVLAGGAHATKLVNMLQQVGFHINCQHNGSMPIKDITEDECSIDIRTFMEYHAPDPTPATIHNSTLKLDPLSHAPSSKASLAELIWAFLLSLSCLLCIYRPIVRLSLSSPKDA